MGAVRRCDPEFAERRFLPASYRWLFSALSADGHGIPD